MLRFTPQRARRMAEEQWHPQQQGRILKDGSNELRIPCSDPREVALDVLKQGAEVEVLAPQTLREDVASQLQRGAEQYLKRKVKE